MEMLLEHYLKSRLSNSEVKRLGCRTVLYRQPKNFVCMIDLLFLKMKVRIDFQVILGTFYIPPILLPYQSHIVVYSDCVNL